MLIYPDIDPVAISVGKFEVHWYGLMYLIGFLAAWGLGNLRARNPVFGWEAEEIPDLIFYCALGVILGGRIGYILFYGFSGWVEDPLLILKIWQGGMSYHGGMLGVFVACWLYGLKTGRIFFQVSDFIAPLVPIGLGAGRIGNFINQELWGRPTDLPWGMVFPAARDGLPRHASMLYEAFFEGLVLFLVLWLFSRRPRPVMAVSGLFLIGYGLSRFGVEFVREPDEHLGYLAFNWLTMGQLLTLPMLLFGVLFMWMAYSRQRPQG